MKTEFETDLKLLRDDFTAQIVTMRAYGAENDTLLNALAYANSTYALVENHFMLVAESGVRYWPDWIDQLTDLFTGYCATVYAVLHDNAHLAVLVPNLKDAALSFDTLLRFGRNMADWLGSYRAVVLDLEPDEVPAA